VKVTFAKCNCLVVSLPCRNSSPKLFLNRLVFLCGRLSRYIFLIRWYTNVSVQDETGVHGLLSSFLVIDPSITTLEKSSSALYQHTYTYIYPLKRLLLRDIKIPRHINISVFIVKKILFHILNTFISFLHYNLMM
jgi:hypothetical protein